MVRPYAAVLIIAYLAGQSPGMHPRVLLGGPHTFPCDAITVRDRHIVLERDVATLSVKNDYRSPVIVKWDGSTSTITTADEKASEEWMRSHSLLTRLSVKHKHLYWDDKQVDLGKVNVTELYQALPWQGGVLIYGRTFPRRGFFERWPFKGDFIEARDLEPYCAIFFDPNTLKGEDLWLNGKVMRSFFVYPVPQ